MSHLLIIIFPFCLVSFAAVVWARHGVGGSALRDVPKQRLRRRLPFVRIHLFVSLFQNFLDQKAQESATDLQNSFEGYVLSDQHNLKAAKTGAVNYLSCSLTLHQLVDCYEGYQQTRRQSIEEYFFSDALIFF